MAWRGGDGLSVRGATGRQWWWCDGCLGAVPTTAAEWFEFKAEHADAIPTAEEFVAALDEIFQGQAHGYISLFAHLKRVAGGGEAS